MESILAAGIELIVWIQASSPAGLHAFFEVFTKLGGSWYLYMVPLVLWCVHYKTGTRLALGLAITLVVNTTLKVWIGQPRPFEMDARIISAGEAGFGLPSGHAQMVVVFWGILAAWVGKRWFWGVAIAMIGLIGYSRVHLGVHFPSDVLAGWALGALMLWAYLRERERLEGWLAASSPSRLAALAAGLGLFVVLFDQLLVGDADHLNAGAGGFIAGAGGGIAFASAQVSFEGAGVLWRRAARFALGMVATLAALGGMQAVGVPDGPLANLGVAFWTALLGAWLCLGAPWLFTRIKLG